MKKVLLSIATAAAALSFVGCDKTGTISGQVVDPFTGKAVEMPTVWMDSTIYSTKKDNYAYKAELGQGKFKFENVPAGTYLLKSRRNKYNLSQQSLTTTNENPNAEVKIYLYSDTIAPGMYLPSAEGATKIANEWAIFSTTCKESVAGLRISFEQDMGMVPGQKKKSKKDVKVNKLPDPKTVAAEMDVLYCNKGTLASSLAVASYPVKTAAASAHADCQGFEKNENGLFPDLSKKTELAVEYRSEGLVAIRGTLPKGKQMIVITKEGKLLQSYYVEVK